MTDNHSSAPVPVGDGVPGDPPVPITVWPVPAPERGETMSNPMAVRLVHNLTHPGNLIIDLTRGPQLARAIIATARRIHLQTADATVWGRGREPAALIVTGWPTDPGTPAQFFPQSRAALTPLGCIAVLLAHGDPALPADVVIAAKRARLGYLQHIVAVAHPFPLNKRGHLDIHTDVLIFCRPALTGGDDD